MQTKPRHTALLRSFVSGAKLVFAPPPNGFKTNQPTACANPAQPAERKDGSDNSLKTLMNIQDQLIESHLLFAMLRARRRHQGAMESAKGNNHFASPAGSCGIREDSGGMADPEGDYKRALRQLHDFVSMKIVPADLSEIDSAAQPPLMDLNVSDSNHDQTEAKMAIEELLIEQIGFEMLSAFFGSRQTPGRRVGPDNRRRDHRIDAKHSPALLSDGERFRVPVVILNVSRTGLGVSTELELPIDNTVLIELDNDYKIFGTVRYCLPEDSGAGYSAGIRISNIRTGAGPEV